jgi:hypothetical protein
MDPTSEEQRRAEFRKTMAPPKLNQTFRSRMDRYRQPPLVSAGIIAVVFLLTVATVVFGLARHSVDALLSTTVTSFCAALPAGDSDSAYPLISVADRGRISQDEFAAMLQAAHIASCELAPGSTIQEKDENNATASLSLTYQTSTSRSDDTDKATLSLVREGKWYVSALASQHLNFSADA